jgi:hypothetical protein
MNEMFSYSNIAANILYDCTSLSIIAHGMCWQ